jgi:hypothetical protein
MSSMETGVRPKISHPALATGRSIALTGTEHPAPITGNAEAIADALRNLIENALAHTAPEPK